LWERGKEKSSRRKKAPVTNVGKKKKRGSFQGKKKEEYLPHTDVGHAPFVGKGIEKKGVRPRKEEKQVICKEVEEKKNGVSRRHRIGKNSSAGEKKELPSLGVTFAKGKKGAQKGEDFQPPGRGCRLRSRKKGHELAKLKT